MTPNNKNIQILTLFDTENLIEVPTCFKGTLSCTALTLTNQNIF